MDSILGSVDKSTLSSLGLADGIKATSGCRLWVPPVLSSLKSYTEAQLQAATPICDRCHNLVHHSGQSSTPILHPSIQSIQSMIEDSPHKHNHIYHIIDAADFPMSLIPNLTSSLLLPRLRTQNRRSKTKYARGRVAEVSFIITRSDLLAPQKDQVDGLMPYLRETLREALGKSGERVRLGNVRCVSSKRGWWTKAVKEEVWDRGGAGWMVGKVNVGKSGFFEVVFPKGRGGEDKAPNLRNLRQEEERRLALGVVEAEEAEPAEVKAEDEQQQQQADDRDEVAPLNGESLSDLPGDIDAATTTTAADVVTRSTTQKQDTTHHYSTQASDTVLDVSLSAPEQDDPDPDLDLYDDLSLLPPARKETPYPLMPTVSSLPGTTASPIRIPYGSGKGELIDLPGIQRSNLSLHVQPAHHDDLVMKTRVTPDQLSIKPGQSLLLGGGLIRITPRTDDVVLAYPFVPLNPHVTATAKAEAAEAGERTSGIASIVAEGVFGAPELSSSASDDTPSTPTPAPAENKPSTGKMKSAGIFNIKWDVTRQRAGPLTSTSAAKLRPETLAFRIFGADVLVEGVGWVELVVQVRKRRRSTDARDETSVDIEVESNKTSEPSVSFRPLDSPMSSEQDSESTGAEAHQVYKPLSPPDIPTDPASEIPQIEIFSPEGKFVAIRPPMNAWLLGGRKSDVGGKGTASVGRAKGRPRLSMRSLKGSREGRNA